MASVRCLLAAPVLQEASSASFHRRRARPRRAISGMGHVYRRSMSRAARSLPWVNVSWWKTSRTCPVKVGDFNTDMRLICHEGLTEAFLLTWGEPVARGAQKKPNLIEGIPLASTMTGRVLLDAATHLTWGVASELDDMKGIEHAGGVLELVINGVLAVPGRDPASRSGYRSETVRRARPASSHARCQTFLGPGPTTLPWDDPPLASGPRCR